MDRKRIFIDKKTSVKQRTEIVKWAAQNNYDTVVFPLEEKISPKIEYIKLAKKYELFIEAGGHELSMLIPRSLFTFNRDFFRMDQGKRNKQHHFCPTNPKTTTLIKEHAKEFFKQHLPIVTEPRIFHLLPDQGRETTWCSCPACRAFSPAEQNIIAVNCAADALMQLDAQARLSYFDFGTDPIAPGVSPRQNMFNLNDQK